MALFVQYHCIGTSMRRKQARPPLNSAIQGRGGDVTAWNAQVSKSLWSKDSLGTAEITVLAPSLLLPFLNGLTGQIDTCLPQKSSSSIFLENDYKGPER